MAQTCGVTRFFFSEGQALAAASTCLRTICSTASRLNCLLRLLTKRGSASLPPRSMIQPRSTLMLSPRMGVARSFRPLPRHCTCAPGPRTTSQPDRFDQSETRKPGGRGRDRRTGPDDVAWPP